MGRPPRRHFNACAMIGTFQGKLWFSGGVRFIWQQIDRIQRENPNVVIAVNPTCGDAAFINRKPGYGWRMGR